MNSSERRESIVAMLQKNQQPISANIIAAQHKVSRQVIVNDIAILRASGIEIAATPRGYILQENEAADEIIKKIACQHANDKIGEELYTIVDNGGGILDVIVEHPVYGQICGKLHIFSRYDVDNFLKKLLQSKSVPLCNLTEGVHLHTISCRSLSEYERILSALRDKNILLENENT